MHLPNHGANPQNLLSALKIEAPKNAIDFSVNTNPFGPPPIIEDNWSTYYSTLTHYPDPTCLKLKETIANCNQVEKNNVIVGNGAAEIIFLIAQYFSNKKVLIVEPTFSEYRDACTAFGCEIEQVYLEEASRWQLQVEAITTKINSDSISALFLCHPNNPTGCIYNRESLLTIIQVAKENGVTVIIDEAFYDFCTEDISMSSYLSEYSNLVILRSLTKMFSIAGIRLGYALGEASFIQCIASKQHPWNVNGLAQKIGLQLFSEKGFVQNTARKIEEERIRLFNSLEILGYEVSPSAVNYYILKEKNKDVDSLPLIRFLIQGGIIPRHTYNFNGLDGRYIRLTIKGQAENDKLLSLLKGWKDRCSSL